MPSAPARHLEMSFYRGTVECIHKYSMMRRRIGFTPRKVLSCPSTVLSYIFFLSAYMCAVQHTDYLHFSAHRYAVINELWNEGRFFNPQHYHFGGGLSSRSVDNAGQSMSHCRKTSLVNKSFPITPSVEIFISYELWLGVTKGRCGVPYLRRIECTIIHRLV